MAEQLKTASIRAEQQCVQNTHLIKALSTVVGPVSPLKNLSDSNLGSRDLPKYPHANFELDIEANRLKNPKFKKQQNDSSEIFDYKNNRNPSTLYRLKKLEKCKKIFYLVINHHHRTKITIIINLSQINLSRMPYQ